MPFFLLFVIVPIIEISLFISVGGAIGIWPTIMIVLATALFGSIMIKLQGREAMARIQRAVNGNGNIGRELASGAAIIIAGALMVTPGFFTDVIGFLLLIPVTRGFILEFLGRHIKFQTIQGGASHPHHPGQRRTRADDDVIEGEVVDTPHEHDRNKPL